MTPRAPSRRTFLQSAALGVLAVARPATALAPPDARVGLVGLGLRGRALLEACPVPVLGLCDVDRTRLDSVGDSEVFRTRDFRELVRRNDLDTILIATPNHSHAMIALEALRQGKHVHVESPAACTLREARELAATARRFDRQLRVAHDDATDAIAAALREWLTDATEIHATLYAPPNQQGGDPLKATDPPDEFDWEAWLEPAPRRPYNPDYAHVQWRWMMDFGGGMIRQHAPPLLKTLLKSTQTNKFTHIATSTKSADPAPGLWDCPPLMETTWTFVGSNLSVKWTQASDIQTVGMMLTADGQTAELSKTTRGYTLETSGQSLKEIKTDTKNSLLSTWDVSSYHGQTVLSDLRAESLVEAALLSYRQGSPLRLDWQQGLIRE